MTVRTERLKIVHPARPGPVKLYDEKWQGCESGKMVCVTPDDARKSVENKIAVGRWMTKMNGLVTYYEKQTADPEPLPAKK
ncbi:hypothetical protein [Faunimonas pinastri]|uniref:hypothetical protein n=1 Tax=Faunimonas pinastri TaxID=1855383 RepID=UPI000B875638|nr:hypothetical protein [Faunimonas pinastri]